MYVSGYNGTVYARRDGRRIWNTEADSSAEQYGPAVADGVGHVGSDDWNVYALHAQSGARMWTTSTEEAVISGPVVANNVIYADSNNPHLYALADLDGARIWTYQTGGQVRSVPVTACGIVYVDSDEREICTLQA
jgi:outer membrane protein assembly factor BamB